MKVIREHVLNTYLVKNKSDTPNDLLNLRFQRDLAAVIFCVYKSTVNSMLITATQDHKETIDDYRALYKHILEQSVQLVLKPTR